MLKLSSIPWWTEADAAELAMLTGELVRAASAHRGKCPDCVPGRTGHWCAALTEALDAIVDWRDSRIRLSRAVWLRERQNDVEALSVAATTRPARMAEAA